MASTRSRRSAWSGATEQALTAAGTPYEAGIARYRETARGLLIADPYGLLKVLFHPQSRRLLGIHAIGTGATELIHIGQAVMAAGMTIDYFVESVFNYPTLAECYKIAALDGINRDPAGGRAGRGSGRAGKGSGSRQRRRRGFSRRSGNHIRNAAIGHPSNLVR